MPWGLALFAALVLLARPAQALPGPEVLVPVSLGLLQVVAFAVAGIWARRHRWLKRRVWAPIAAFALLLLWNGLAALLFAVLVVAWRRGRLAIGIGVVAALLAAQALAPRPVPTALAVLPAMADAQPAPPIPESGHPRLRAGGAIIVHLGEPERFLNCRLPHGYALRPADRDARRAELQAQKDRIVWVGDEPGMHRPERDETICYTPPAALLWRMLVTHAAIGADTAESPLMLRHSIPRLRDVDGGSHPSLRATDILATPTAALDKHEGPLVVTATNTKDLASATNRLTEAGVAVAGARLRGAPRAPAIRLTTPAVVGGLLLLVAVAALLEALVRRRRDRALAKAMREGRRLARGWSLAWLVIPMLPGIAAVAAFPRVGLPSALWGIASPPMFGPHRWLFPVALLAVGALWLLRLTRLPPSGRRLGELAGIAMGPWVLAGQSLSSYPNAWQLLALGASMAGALALPRRGAGWCRLRAAGTLGDPARAGDKARDLARVLPASEGVAEGLVLWPEQREIPALVARLEATYGAGAFLVRSTVPGESTAYGRFASAVAEDGTLAKAIEEVLASYPDDRTDPAVLVMPLIDAPRSGVARIDHGGVLLEKGTGRDGVTAGDAVTERASWGRWTQRLQGEADALLMRDMARLPWSPPAIVEHVGPWIVQHVAAPAGGWRDRAWSVVTEHDLLPGAFTRIDAELQDPAAPRTLALWADTWTRDAAFGVAGRWLGLPRWLLPAHLVHAIDGGLFVHGPSQASLSRWLWLRSRLGWNAGRRFAVVVAALREQPQDPQILAASSIALRLLQPHLPAEGEAPKAPSLLVHAEPEAYPHRGEAELDPTASPGRLGPAIPLADDLAPNRAACAYLRDWIHDGLCRWATRLAVDDPTWADETASGSPARGTISLPELEGWDPRASGTGRWVEGEGPVEGTVGTEPGTILFVDMPTAANMRAGHVAIVARRGGQLSHAALICQAEGLTALFGVGESLAQGDRVRLERDGSITRLP